MDCWQIIITAIISFLLGNIDADLVRGYIEYMEPILTSWITNTTALNPKEFCDNKKKFLPLPTPELLGTVQGSASDSHPSVIAEQISRHQNTTAPNPEDFGDNTKNLDISPLPTQNIIETEQGDTSDSQPGAVGGQTPRHYNFDLNKLPDEV